MEINKETLRTHYQSMETEELIQLHQRGQLTEIANEVLNDVLRERDINDIPATEKEKNESQEKRQIIQRINENPTHSLIAPIPPSWKPSLWWIVHFWGGLCLKIYVENSGLLERLLGPQDPTLKRSLAHAEFMASVTVLITMGSLLIGFIASKKLFDLVDSYQIPEAVKLATKLSLPVVYFAILTGLYALSMEFSLFI